MRLSRLSQKLAALERDRGRRAASAGYRPNLYLDRSEEFFDTPEGRAPMDSVDLWLADHGPNYLVIEICEADPSDDGPAPPGIWTT